MGRVAPAGQLGSFQITVGTDKQRLSDDFPTYTVVLKADDDNTGNIYVGNSDVTTSSGLRLSPGQSLSIDIDNLNKVYVIADTADQKLYVLWLR